MALAALTHVSPPSERLDAVERAICELLREAPIVEAAYVSSRCHDVHITAIIPEHGLAAGEMIVDVEEKLQERFSDLSFEVTASAHQGRRDPRHMYSGLTPLYVRDA